MIDAVLHDVQRVISKENSGTTGHGGSKWNAKLNIPLVVVLLFSSSRNYPIS